MSSISTTDYWKRVKAEFEAKREAILASNTDNLYYVWTDDTADCENLRDEVLPTSTMFDESDAVQIYCNDLDDIGEYGNEIDGVFALRYLCEIPREYKVVIDYDPVFTAYRQKESA